MEFNWKIWWKIAGLDSHVGFAYFLFNSFEKFWMLLTWRPWIWWIVSSSPGPGQSVIIVDIRRRRRENIIQHYCPPILIFSFWPRTLISCSLIKGRSFNTLMSPSLWSNFFQLLLNAWNLLEHHLKVWLRHITKLLHFNFHIFLIFFKAKQ